MYNYKYSKYKTIKLHLKMLSGYFRCKKHDIDQVHVFFNVYFMVDKFIFFIYIPKKT